MAESSSASERSRSPSPARAVNAPKSSRTFVWLRELPKAIPRGKTWDQLNRDGRVKDIEFGKDFTERQMLKLVRENFTELGEADFSRIRLYKSGSRGSVLKKVAKNMPAASTLLSKFRGGSSKRVYFLLKSDDENGGGPSSRNDPSSIVTVSAAQDNSQNTTPPVTDNAGVPPMLALPYCSLQSVVEDPQRHY